VAGKIKTKFNIMNVPYEKQTLENPNPIARFAHKARFKRSKAIVIGWLGSGATVLDYGCGHGRFLAELSPLIGPDRPNCKLLGYDPYLAVRYENYIVIDNLDVIRDESVDIITCLEVMEHLDSEETQQFVQLARRKLVHGGKLLVTVPIMVGPALILKELSRCILFRRKSDTTLWDLFLGGALGISPPRAENIKASHRGFEWEKAYSILLRNFECIDLSFSPLPVVGWYGNSQAIMQFQKTSKNQAEVK
jgi:SAM-dependent methyltransferase